MNGRKDGKQKYRVRINYVDDYGRSKQIDRVAYGLDEAKQLERELNYQIKHEKPAQRMTVQALYDEYIKSKRHEVKESSLMNTTSTLSLHVLPLLGSVKLDKLNAKVLEEWKRQISDIGFCLTTRKNIFNEFRTMLNFAVKLEYIQNNPLVKVGNFKAPLEVKKEMDFYTAEEFKKYISVAKKYCSEQGSLGEVFEWSYYVFFCIAFYTGMRKGEINALLWTDIKDNKISLTKSVSQRLYGQDRITPPKNKSSIREIEIPKPLEKVLEEHKKRLEEYNQFKEDNFICGGEKSLRDSNIQRRNEKFAKLAELKQIRVHDFRHSHASFLIQNGINIQEVARRLGHSKIETTLSTYAHLYPSEKERAISVLNQVKI